jgi:tetratricopeptide (TPR) repeat protein
MTDDLLGRLRARIDALALHADEQPILEDAALREAEQLLGRYPGRNWNDASSDADVEALRTVALFHWYRYCVRESDAGREDFDMAVRLFTKVYQCDPAAVPEQLHPLVTTHDQAQEPEEPEESLTWASLASTFYNRFRRIGDPRALRSAIALLTAELEAGQDTVSEQIAICTKLVTARLDLYRLTGDLATLREAARIAGSAVAAAPDRHSELREAPPALDTLATAVIKDPNGPAYLNNMATILLELWYQSGDPQLLDEAISNLEAAVAAIAIGHDNRAVSLSNLGIALRTRFEQGGMVADLDAAIEAGRRAVDVTPADNPERPGRLSNLGIALLARFARTGEVADLDAAIEVARAAVAATPAGLPRQAAMLSNLGNALRTRFARSRASSDLDAAIEAGRRAVDATPAGHPDWPGRLSNLGNALRARFEYTGVPADLDAAIEAGRRAVDVTPAGHPDRPGRLSNLGIALLARLERTGEVADLDAAIETGRAAVSATPAGHLNHAIYLSSLANALQARFERTRTAADQNAALAAYTEAAALGPAAPSIRIQAARRAAALAAQPAPGHAARLLETAVRLLPEVAPRVLERRDQQHVLGSMTGLASDAAALTLSDTTIPSGERATRALQLLEAGRAVLLSQTLDTRSDLTDLRHRHPQLADRFTELRDRIDQPAGDLPAETARADIAGRSADNPAYLVQDRRDLAYQFAEVLAEIRSMPGFAAFGLPPQTSELLNLAEPGPVVTFNVSTYRSDALLLTPEGISSLELPGLAHSELSRKISSFYGALETSRQPDSAEQWTGAQVTLSDVLEWLWDTAAGPVLDALGYCHQPQEGTKWPRVWWVPGGPLSLLPLHAAGHHDDPPGDHGRRTVIDRVISSYTPTLRALRYGRLHALSAPAPDRTLIVSMPTTPGLPDAALPGVPGETATLAALLPSPVLLAEPDTRGSSTPDRLPTRGNVLANLPDCAIAHFSCHGASHPADPSRSMLLLHDYDSAPFTVASLAPVNLGRAQLAFLSACSTAVPSTAELADEAIHLTTAFQLAGFPHVIGTLWAIDDRNAAMVADAFYTYIATEPGNVDTTLAADALHHAIRTIRHRYPRYPFRWAGYLHAGS